MFPIDTSFELFSVISNVGFSNGRDGMGRAIHALCKWGFWGERGSATEGLWLLVSSGWRESRNGPRLSHRTVCGAPGDTHREVKLPTLPHTTHGEGEGKHKWKMSL